VDDGDLVVLSGDVSGDLSGDLSGGLVGISGDLSGGLVGVSGGLDSSGSLVGVSEGLLKIAWRFAGGSEIGDGRFAGGDEEGVEEEVSEVLGVIVGFGVCSDGLFIV
jgi:hypothetical protein